MATHLYAGQPGAGKTTSAMERSIVPWVKSGGIVVTNIPVNEKRKAWEEMFERWRFDAPEDQAFDWDFDRQIIQVEKWIGEPGTDGHHRVFGAREDYERFIKSDDHEGMVDHLGRGVMFAIDEAHEVLPTGMRFDTDRKTGQLVDSFPNFIHLLFTMQRHHLINFVLITQEPLSISHKIRKQVHTSFYVMNAEMKGSSKRWTAKIWNSAPPNNYVKAPLASCDDAIATPQPYNRDIQALFESQTMKVDFDSDAVDARGLEGQYHLSKSIWKRPIFLFVFVPALVAAVFTIPMLFTLFDDNAAQIAGVEPEDNQPLAVPETTTNPFQEASASSGLSPEEQELEVTNLELEEDRGTFQAWQQQETLWHVSLYAMESHIPGKAHLQGPSIAVHDDAGNVVYYFLSDYASYWRYDVQPIYCGFKLQRKDFERLIYDRSCLGRTQAQTPPAASSSSSGASPGTVADAVPGVAREALSAF